MTERRKSDFITTLKLGSERRKSLRQKHDQKSLRQKHDRKSA